MRPDVSVIMPTYNSLSELTRSVGSVMRQTIGRDRMELITVDDCSTDGTYEELRRLAGEWSGMLVLRTAENSGSGGAPRNLALERVCGRYVFMLDSDDYLAPDALERMVDYADENDTEIVLPRLEGVGDRRVPQSMFRRSQPRTDVWSSRVNWSLAPMKLLSTELLERARIRFPEDMKYASDQPFVTEAYLAATGISVLADKPYYYVYNRDDRSNSTLQADPDRRLIALNRMLGLLSERVDPGPRRNFLLQRQFMIETMQIVNTARRLDRGPRNEVLTSLADLTRPHFNDSIGNALPPFHRVFIDLLYRGMFDELYEVFAEKDGAEPEVIVEAGRAFELWPFFRDADTDIPDSRYDITQRIRARAHLSTMAWEGSTLLLSGHAHIDRLGSSAPGTALVLRKRDIGTECLIDTESISPPALSPGPGRVALDRGAAGFTAEVDVASAGDGGPLSDGLWDISIRLKHEGLICEARLGGSHDPDARSDHRLRLVLSRRRRLCRLRLSHHHLRQPHARCGRDQQAHQARPGARSVEPDAGRCARGGWQRQRPARARRDHQHPTHWRRGRNLRDWCSGARG